MNVERLLWYELTELFVEILGTESLVGDGLLIWRREIAALESLSVLREQEQVR
jgi:hypothetical protein